MSYYYYFLNIHLPFSSVHEVGSWLAVSSTVLFTYYAIITPEMGTLTYIPKLQWFKAKQQLHHYFGMFMKSWLNVLERLDRRVGEIKTKRFLLT